MQHKIRLLYPPRCLWSNYHGGQQRRWHYHAISLVPRPVTGFSQTANQPLLWQRRLSGASFEQDGRRNLHTMNTKSSERSRMHHGRSKGFTLIELMIVVAIVAILTTIAYPNYRDYVIRGQLVDATQGLSALRANLERYFQDNRTYAAIGPFTPPCS